MSKRKVPSDDNKNHELCEMIIELANYERNVSRNIHKYHAYRKAANSIAAYDKKITSIEQVKGLEGVGKRITQKVDEFLRSGKLRKLDIIRQDDTNIAIETLTRVSGIGPSTAQELVKLGIWNIQDLREHTDKLNHHQRIGLKYFEDFEQRIPRREIRSIEKRIKEYVHGLDSYFEVTICGSYRRGRPESGDVDALVTHPSFTSKTSDKSHASELLNKIVTKLQNESLIIDVISQGDVKFMGVCKVKQVARRLDIRLTPHDQYHCAVLYFTGSDMFNKQMRSHALQVGFTLNEYSLRPLGSTGVAGEPVPITSERDIFDYIDFPYKEPYERG